MCVNRAWSLKKNDKAAMTTAAINGIYEVCMGDYMKIFM